MGFLPQVSGQKLCAVLKRYGYEIVSQRGSHIKLKLISGKKTHTIIIPSHHTIAKGTLNDILNKICPWIDSTKEELIDKLR